MSLRLLPPNPPRPTSTAARLLAAALRWSVAALALLAANAGPLAAAETPPPPEFTMAPANEKPIELPPFHVTVTRDERGGPIYRIERFLDRLYTSPFLNLRSGALIEAIVWRHGYLAKHPNEAAIILVEERGPGVISATTVFTREGQLRASSQVLGNDVRLHGFTAADIRDVAKIRREIEGRRAVYLGFVATNEDRAIAQDGSTASGHSPRAASEARAHGDPTHGPRFVDEAPSGPWDLLGVRITLAEETGDYSHIIPPFGFASMDNSLFAGPADEVLRRTYDALHDPDQAGFVPVARAVFNIPDNPAGRGPTLRPIEAVVFDWEGRHYLYHPDRGTYSMPIPVNPVTREPYLCLKHGDLLESIHFCVTYLQGHPGDKAVLLAPRGGPCAAVYTVGDRLHLFSPFLGRTIIPKRLGLRLEDVAALARLHATLVGLERQRLAAAHQAANPNSISEELPGDDTDMQMRRAFLSLWADGVQPRLVPRLDSEGRPLAPPRHALVCEWRGATYTYDIDGPLTTSITSAPASAK